MSIKWVIVPSASMYEVTRDGDIRKSKYCKLQSKSPIRPSLNTSGYVTVGIRFDNCKSAVINLHRLIAMTFIPNPDGKPQVNHINGIRHHNYIENLEWVTPAENCQHGMYVNSTDWVFNPNVPLITIDEVDIRCIHLRTGISLPNLYKLAKGLLI